jgi:uncharacterized protein
LVFKRRTPRGWVQTFTEFFYPRGGWWRAATYVLHRVRRLPDKPHRIARGMWAGVFISCTPLFGLHLAGAALITLAVRGNLVAAVIGTFFGNPLTYVPLCLLALELGNWIMGRGGHAIRPDILTERFVAAGDDLWRNLWAMFSTETARWGGLADFYHGIFLPSVIGGFVSGAVFATICYYLTVPLVSYYQTRRSARFRKRLAEARAAASKGVADPADGGTAGE